MPIKQIFSQICRKYSPEWSWLSIQTETILSTDTKLILPGSRVSGAAFCAIIRATTTKYLLAQGAWFSTSRHATEVSRFPG